jgi:Mce-associated membrane protein
MTETPQDHGPDGGAASDVADELRPADRPRPSPTSRARRTAAASTGARPSPRPSPGPSATTSTPGVAKPGSDDPVGSDELVDVEVRAPKKPRVAGPRDTLWLAGGLAAAVAALIVLNVLLLTWHKKGDPTNDRERVLAAAKSAVPVILSYNYQHFDSDTAAGSGQLTGRAKDDYQKAMSTTIKPAATQTKAVVEALVDTAGIESVSDSGKQVSMIVFGQQKVTNTAVSAPRTDPFRIRVIMDRVDGKWLVSKFDQI